ncbi:MAG: Nif3-like dinuclear metal center hexameric protein [Oscillospiraceae bacterium]|nr:Nif3-like dinuclear metal center hexameric protein [Oscillospiraceae bacterium]
MKVHEIYAFLQELAPFETQESYDNSGFLVGDKDAEVTKICLCLDITLDVVAEAAEKGANLIISHHPVIFKALSDIKAGTAVHRLAKHEINAICAHTNFDNDILPSIMADLLGFPQSGILPNEITADELAKRCKSAFKSPFAKYVDGGKPIRRVAVCPGSGGSKFDEAVENGCDAFITGEMKHSDMIKAKDLGVTLIEAGHFHTEIILCDFLKSKIYERFPQVPLFIADSATEPCKYL